MFFDDLVAAFANVRRSLRPDGVLSFASWQDVFANEWMLVPGLAALTALGVAPTPPDPDAPGPFRLSDPDKVRTILGAAGFAEVDVVPHQDSLTGDAGRIPELAATSSRVGLVNELLRDRGDADRQRVISAIEDAFRQRIDGGTLRLARCVLLVTARR